MRAVQKLQEFKAYLGRELTRQSHPLFVGVRRKKDKEAERDITKQNASRAADLPR